jgi:hypothetical protein
MPCVTFTLNLVKVTNLHCTQVLTMCSACRTLPWRILQQISVSPRLPDLMAHMDHFDQTKADPGRGCLIRLSYCAMVIWWKKLKIGFLKPSSKAEQGGQNATKNSQVYRFIQYPCWLLNFVPAFSPLHAAVSPEIAMQRERETCTMGMYLYVYKTYMTMCQN